MIKRLLTIKANSALLFYIIIPFGLMILSLISATFFDSTILFVIFFGIVIINFLFFITWRLILGWVTYDMSSKLHNRQHHLILFVFFSIVNILIIPLTIAVVFNIDKYPGLIFGFVILIMIYGLISNYFQCDFISRNLSLIKYKKIVLKELQPINWTTIACFPMTVIKTQRVLIELLNKQPMPNSAS